MNRILKVNYENLIATTEKINNPFSRELYISTIKEDIGNGILIKYDIGNGIAVFARNFTTTKNILLIEESTIPAGVFIFNLGEKLLFKYKNQKEYLLQKNTFLAALTSNKFYSEVLLEKNKHYLTISIGMKEELFKNLIKPFENIKIHQKKVEINSCSIFKDKEIDLWQMEILSYFKVNNSYENLLNNLFLESKISDLAHYTIQKIVSSEKNKTLTKARSISVQRAKEIILQEYDNNQLSIKTIANKAATNECYLKKDFKIYFGKTIYEVLQEHRMYIAKDLLKEGLDIKSITSKVGYKHSSNFSKTFFKYFHISPSEYKKNLKNI